jgi:hypothetical protein
MDFKKNRVDVKKSLDSLIGGLPEDEVDDDKHNMDPLQYVQVKTEIKVSDSFFKSFFLLFFFIFCLCLL